MSLLSSPDSQPFRESPACQLPVFVSEVVVVRSRPCGATFVLFRDQDRISDLKRMEVVNLGAPGVVQPIIKRHRHTFFYRVHMKNSCKTSEVYCAEFVASSLAEVPKTARQDLRKKQLSHCFHLRRCLRNSAELCGTSPAKSLKLLAGLCGTVAEVDPPLQGLPQRPSLTGNGTLPMIHITRHAEHQRGN